MTISTDINQTSEAASVSEAAFVPSEEPTPASGAGIGIAEPSDYFELMKPRVMSLVIFTAFVGLIAASASVSLFQGFAIILCIAVGAGASAALNMWYDADIDAKMTRTRKRPVPRGVVSKDAALGFGIFMSVASVWALYHTANALSAGLLAFTIFFYVVIYTMWLKRTTPQNIVIGGTPGALPPVIGWAAVTGSTPIDAWILFLIIFLWTPPHFWALALYKRGDYAKVGIPMMPNVKGAKSTRNQIFAYALVLAAICAAPLITGFGGLVYGVAALLLNGGFIYLAFKVWRSRAGETPASSDDASLYAVKKGDNSARNLFAFSILYLFGLFGAIAVEAFIKGLGS